jgi:hypothetical protein
LREAREISPDLPMIRLFKVNSAQLNAQRCERIITEVVAECNSVEKRVGEKGGSDDEAVSMGRFVRFDFGKCVRSSTEEALPNCRSAEERCL